MTASGVGIIMRDVVQRAMTIIRTWRFTHTSEAKETAYKKEMDLVTNADKAAQVVYLKILRECFPDCGIVAEEGELSLPGTNGFYFTVDPLDGTKAYGRLENTGISTMLSLVHGDDIVAVYIGDVMTGDLYYYRPHSSKVHLIDPASGLYELHGRYRAPLAGEHLLLRDPLDQYAPELARLMAQGNGRPLCRGYDVAGGSIGVGFARLWTGSVGALALRPGTQTPWDLCPVLGISRKLGFRFVDLEATCAVGRIVEAPLRPSRENQRTSSTTLVFHQDNSAEVQVAITHLC